MLNNLNNEHKIVTGFAQARRVLATLAIYITGILIVLCATLSAAQQTDSNGDQAPSNPTSSGNTVTVPAGTRMLVRMKDAVDSDNSRPNDRFGGVLEANLMAGDVLVAPKGTMVYGRLLTAESSGRTSGGELELDITEILIDGTLHSLRTTSKQVQGEEGTSTATQTARGAGAGAAVGGIVGAGVGFGARAGAIAGNVAGGRTRGEKVSVPADAIVDFTLDHPVLLPTAQR